MAQKHNTKKSASTSSGRPGNAPSTRRQSQTMSGGKSSKASPGRSSMGSAGHTDINEEME